MTGLTKDPHAEAGHPGAAAGGATPLLELEHVQQYFPVRSGLLGRAGRGGRFVRAVDDVSLSIARGETLGLVGESGCGKSTLARTAMRLLDPTGGTIRFDGTDVTTGGRSDLRPLRAKVQMVFQDPQGSLNPRRRIGTIVGDALELRNVPSGERRREAGDLLERVGLLRQHLDRYPNEFSGGQRQRIGIARALATGPDLLICDEPVSALDVSVQAQIVNLLADLQRELGLAQLFVAHDLSVVRQVADRVAVMYLGRIVERGPTATIFARPRHPYSKALLSAVPIADPHRRQGPAAALGGEPPSPIDPPPACHFHTRCPRATEICKTVQPPLWRYADGAAAACHHPHDTSEADIAAGSRDATSPIAAGDVAPDATGGRP